MRIYVYASQLDPRIVGFTRDETGANLPSDLGPWDREDVPGITVMTETGDPISDAVERDGFHVVDDRRVLPGLHSEYISSRENPRRPRAHTSRSPSLASRRGSA
jgi:hypothetical protein